MKEKLKGEKERERNEDKTIKFKLIRSILIYKYKTYSIYNKKTCRIHALIKLVCIYIYIYIAFQNRQ